MFNRRIVGYLMLALCFLSMGAALLAGGGGDIPNPFSLILAFFAVVTGMLAAISFRP